MKHMSNLLDYSKEEILEIILLGIEMKKNPGKYSQMLKGRSMTMWFEKPSLRTRMSFESGILQLGGHGIYLDMNTTHAKKAKLEDEIKCLSKFTDLIVARVNDHETINKMMSSSDVPVINALCNKFHPCQALADFMTIFETFDDPFTVTLAYVGDGNNVCNSLVIVGKKLGIKVNVASPIDLKPASEPGLYSVDPKAAVHDADVIYTDTWVSMGMEAEKDALIAKLKPYQVNKKLICDKYFMHCLPAIRGNEVTDEVIDSGKSLVFQQAENRMHVQKAIMVKLLCEGSERK